VRKTSYQQEQICIVKISVDYEQSLFPLRDSRGKGTNERARLFSGTRFLFLCSHVCDKLITAYFIQILTRLVPKSSLTRRERSTKPIFHLTHPLQIFADSCFTPLSVAFGHQNFPGYGIQLLNVFVREVI